MLTFLVRGISNYSEDLAKFGSDDVLLFLDSIFELTARDKRGQSSFERASHPKSSLFGDKLMFVAFSRK